jgi:dipeptidyl aminopeptidase/acylaminoacyl peptidase
MRNLKIRVLVFLGVLAACLVIGLAVSAVTGHRVPTPGLAIPIGQARVRDLSFSPDGHTLAFLKYTVDETGAADTQQVVLADAVTGRLLSTTPGPMDTNPVWNPDGAALYFNSVTPTATAVQRIAREDPANAVPVLDKGVNQLGRGSHLWFDASRLLLVRRAADHTATLAAWNLATRKLDTLCPLPAGAVRASASADGTLVACLVREERSMSLQVLDCADHTPVFSPQSTTISDFRWGDGHTLYYVCGDDDAKGNVELHAIAFPSTMDTLVAQYTRADSAIALGPDSRVAVTTYDGRQKRMRIYVYSTGNGQLVAASNGRDLGAFSPCWSADGRYFAYASLENGTGACVIHVISTTALASRAWTVR